MSKFLARFKENLNKYWDFLLIEVGAFLFFEFFVFKLELIKAVIVTVSVILVSLVLFVALSVNEVLK
ncbi:MAG: hypothetical protein DSY47_04080 [Hydrogenothermus sp.]|nr:MAG: hypothetical protein DSY47_04080 [Hydrogenothermus sp.]